MDPHHLLGLAQLVEVAPDGLRRDAEDGGQFLDPDTPLLAQQVDDLGVTAGRQPGGRQVHRRVTS